MKKVKISLCIVFTLFLTVVHAQADRKFWSSYNKLRWTDYHGRADGQSKFTAFTYFGLDYNYRGEASIPYKFTFEVNSYMDRHLSWRKGLPSANLLKHEQLHFDIAEYFARQLLQAFNAQVYTANYKSEIAAVEERIAKLRRGMEEIYDVQTFHSVNKEAQLQWDQYVADLLNKNYSLVEALDRMPKLESNAILSDR